jgi:hypothetical protein
MSDKGVDAGIEILRQPGIGGEDPHEHEERDHRQAVWINGFEGEVRHQKGR